MIKDQPLDGTRNSKINVLLKNGEFYKHKDYTSAPFGKNENFISFWETPKKIKIIPLNLVKEVEIIFES